MPTAREMPTVQDQPALHAAAAEQRRVRVRGVVSEKGWGYSGRYRNVWLRIETAGASVRVTATQSSPLGGARLGNQVDMALTMTGMLDVASGVYFGERAQLLDLATKPLS